MKNQSSVNFYTDLSDNWPFIGHLPDGVHLYHCTFNLLKYCDGLYAKLGIPLPTELKTASTKRKAEYLAGRHCAKTALKCLNISAIPHSQTDRSPLWPNSSIGSITHSHNIAAAIVAATQEWLTVGLDIELLLSESRSQKLLSQIMSSNEMKLIKDEIAFFTTLTFSIKESLFKALYPVTKKRFYFHDAEIVDWDKSGEVIVKLKKNLSSTWKKGRIIKGLYCLKENYIWTFISISQ